jgi:ferrochelatase
VVAAGDPYQAQVEATAAAVAAQVPEFTDWRICYQSRVGPLKWIGPSTEAEIRAASAEGLGVLVSPIAFVSEHVETLVELDHDYAAVAKAAGCAPYLRAPALGIDAQFVGGLVDTVMAALAKDAGVAPAGPWRCPGTYRNCALKGAAA